jgi:5-methylcytosine-specific restriction endonuclease McrA
MNKKSIFDKSGGRCWYCGKDLEPMQRLSANNYKIPSNTYVMDHVVPKINGGTDEPENLVPACWTCNGIKRTLSLEEFRDVMTRMENGAPRFSREQLFYLSRVGVELPVYEPHIFYFEKEGLS